jgi:MFS family permease
MLVREIFTHQNMSAEPLFSKFSDIWGRKAVLLFGTSVFLLGSVLSGAATVRFRTRYLDFILFTGNGILIPFLEYHHVDCF